MSKKHTEINFSDIELKLFLFILGDDLKEKCIKEGGLKNFSHQGISFTLRKFAYNDLELKKNSLALILPPFEKIKKTKEANKKIEKKKIEKKKIKKRIKKVTNGQLQFLECKLDDGGWKKNKNKKNNRIKAFGGMRVLKSKTVEAHKKEGAGVEKYIGIKNDNTSFGKTASVFIKHNRFNEFKQTEYFKANWEKYLYYIRHLKKGLLFRTKPELTAEDIDMIEKIMQCSPTAFDYLTSSSYLHSSWFCRSGIKIQDTSRKEDFKKKRAFLRLKENLFPLRVCIPNESLLCYPKESLFSHLVRCFVKDNLILDLEDKRLENIKKILDREKEAKDRYSRNIKNAEEKKAKVKESEEDKKYKKLSEDINNVTKELGIKISYNYQIGNNRKKGVIQS